MGFGLAAEHHQKVADHGGLAILVQFEHLLLGQVVQCHPAVGYDILEPLKYSEQVRLWVYQHHERLDGRGYPAGLVDEEIHDWARICKVADVFDALSSDRPYRKAEPLDKVLDFLVERIGTEFDKDMVQCLLAMIKSES